MSDDVKMIPYRISTLILRSLTHQQQQQNTKLNKNNNKREGSVVNCNYCLHKNTERIEMKMDKQFHYPSLLFMLLEKYQESK